MIDVSLSVKSPDAPPEAAERWDTILPPWAGQDGEEAVRVATQDYFDTETWDEWFGLDETDCRVVVQVSAPESIAGTYEVTLERVTKTRQVKRT